MHTKLFTGPMFAGKTRRLVTELEKYVIAKKDVIWFEPKRDTRGRSHGSFISQRMEELKNSSYVHSFTISKPDELIKEASKIKKQHPEIACIFIDEYFMIPFKRQFFYDYYDTELRDIPLVFAGLTVGWGAKLLDTAIEILPFMDEIDKEDAICMQCGKPANYSYYKGGIEAWNSLGLDPIDTGKNYICLCHDCYIKETKKPIEEIGWKD